MAMIQSNLKNARKEKNTKMKKAKNISSTRNGCVMYGGAMKKKNKYALNECDKMHYTQLNLFGGGSNEHERGFEEVPALLPEPQRGTDTLHLDKNG